MSNINLEKVLLLVPSLTAAEKIVACEAMLVTKSEKIDDVKAAVVADNPERIRAIHAARGEADRLGVKIGADGRVDVIELNRALDQKSRQDVTWTPQKRIASKVLLANAGMID